MAPKGNLILEAEGKRRSCELADAILYIQTEKWVEGKRRWFKSGPGEWMYGAEHSRAMFELEVTVDEESGADGAAAPVLRIFFDPSAWRGSGLASLANSSWRHGQGCEIEAFYGNDAPSIDICTVNFGSWTSPSMIEIEWSGCMRWRPNESVQPFRLQGLVRLGQVSIRVKSADDIEPIFATVLPGFDLGRLGLSKVVQEDFGEVMPANRRNWETHTWISFHS